LKWFFESIFEVIVQILFKAVLKKNLCCYVVLIVFLEELLANNVLKKKLKICTSWLFFVLMKKSFWVKTCSEILRSFCLSERFLVKLEILLKPRKKIRILLWPLSLFQESRNWRIVEICFCLLDLFWKKIFEDWSLTSFDNLETFCPWNYTKKLRNSKFYLKQNLFPQEMDFFVKGPDPSKDSFDKS